LIVDTVANSDKCRSRRKNRTLTPASSTTVYVAPCMECRMNRFRRDRGC
jgi:hypothetical protein